MAAGTSSRNPDVPIPFDACDPSGTFVFVSYAHEDKALAYPELRRIRSLGIRVWYDEGIEPGSEWPQAIADALYGAAAFVVMITSAAVASRNVRNEINAALKWGKPFFAVHLTQTQLPLGLELQMGDVQAVMRWQMDEGSYARKLGRALASYAEAGNEAPPAGPPASAPSQSAPDVTSRVTFAPIPDATSPVTFQPIQALVPPVHLAPVHLARTLTGHTNWINGVAFSPDGRLLATAGDSTELWEPATGPDGRLLATVGRWDPTAGSHSPAELWDPATGEHLRTLTGHDGPVHGVAFSPDGRLLATASYDHTTRVWDPATGKHLRTLTGHDNLVLGVAFSPDGRLLATVGDDNTARLWD